MAAFGSGLQLQLLGKFTMRREEETLPRLRTRKEGWLLALLLLRHPQPVERAWLVATLWPDSDDVQARYNLRRSLNNLRIVFGPDAFRLTAPIPHTLALDLSGIQVDILEFDAAIRRNDPVSLREAVGLYGGPFLTGCDEVWAVGERMQREQAYLCALEALGEEAMQRQQPAEAATQFRQVLNVDPLRENAVQGLLRALAALGDISGALTAYRDFRLLLRRELHAEPNAQTRLLFERIKAGQTVETPPAEPKQNVSQGALPHPLTGIVGREEEIDAICRDVRNTRFVTLTGSGGIGKTRLAVEAAARCQDLFRGGIWFVDLTAIEASTQVAPAVAQTLQVQEDPQRPTLETLQRALHARELLLILDNCEHLIAACAELARSLLQACPHLHLLATSRQSLGLAGERVRRIPPLSLPPLSDGLLETVALSSPRPDKTTYAQIGTSASVRLFVERAAAVNADFEMTPQNAPSVVQICHQLEGVPFALELAAAWAKALEVEQIAARLRDPLNLLRSGNASGASHRQTLRAMLGWSYSLLSAPEQELLQRLSVFVGGWTLEAAEAVCGDVLEALSQLVDKSLIVYDYLGGSPRYRLLETTRAFARTLLSDAERDAVAERHALYFRQRVATMRGALYERREVRRWDRWALSERANCLAACTWLQERDATKALAFRLDLHYIGVFSYHSPETRRWIMEMHHDPAPPLTLLSADLYCRLGQSALWIGENAIGRSMLEKAILLAGAVGADRVLSEAAYSLGGDEEHSEQFEQAQQHLTLALSYSERADTTLRQVLCRDVLSRLAYLQGDPEEARSLVECNRRIGQEQQDDRILTDVAWRQAWLAGRDGNRREAIRFLEEYLALIRRCDSLPLSGALQRAGQLAYDIGEYAFAQQQLEESCQVSQGNGGKPGGGWAMETLARVAMAQGDLNRAEEYALRSLRLFYVLGERGSVSSVLARLGEVYALQGRGQHEVTLLAHITSSLQRYPFLHNPSFIHNLHAHIALWKEKLPPEAFDEAWQSGWNMTQDQVVAYALADLPQPDPAPLNSKTE